MKVEIEHGQHLARGHPVAGLYVHRAQHRAVERLEHHGRHVGRQPAGRGDDDVDPRHRRNEQQSRDEAGADGRPGLEEQGHGRADQRVEVVLKVVGFGGHA